MADQEHTFKLIQGGEVYTPEPIGRADLLVVNDKIVRVGPVDQKALLALDGDCEIVDAAGCIVTPGLIDPHEHIIGAGGESGFDSRMPEISFEQIILSGITTVVGLLGTDTTTRHLACLHAKAKQLSSEGLTAYLYTGGFEVPPSMFFSRLTDDIVMIDEVIGTGEIAISDYRWMDPPLYELARVVSETMLGGMMSGKAGVTHFHVGDGRKRLSMLKDLMKEYDIPAHCLYPTHITRTSELLDDAIDLARRGCFVDIDVVEENLADCLEAYRGGGGAMEQLTVSSDAHTPGGSPEKLYGQLVDCIRERQMPVETVLPCFTLNPAKALKLSGKGRLEQNADADVLVLKKDSLEIQHVFSRGRYLVKAGQLLQKSHQTQQTEDSKPA